MSYEGSVFLLFNYCANCVHYEKRKAWLHRNLTKTLK